MKTYTTGAIVAQRYFDCDAPRSRQYTTVMVYIADATEAQRLCAEQPLGRFSGYEMLHLCSSESPAVYIPETKDLDRFGVDIVNHYFWGDEARKIMEAESAAAPQAEEQPKVFWIVGGQIYSSFEECESSPVFHPADYQTANSLEEADKIAMRQNAAIENSCYGD